MPWASADEEVGVGRDGLAIGSPAKDVEGKVIDCRSWDVCLVNGNLRRRRDDLQQVTLV